MTAQDRDRLPASERDTALERAWHEASPEQPPSHLDAAIVAAARAAAATHDGPARPGRISGRPIRWLAQRQPLLAAAVVAGLAAVLVPMLPREHGPAPTLQQRQSTSAPAIATEPEVTPSQEDAAVEKPASPPAGTRPRRLEESVVERVVPAPRRRNPEADVPAPPASTPPPAAAGSTTESYAREGVRAGALDSAAAPAEAASPSEPSRWAARIEALHATGEIEAAARELREFRAAEPQADAYLPDALRDWAQTVPPFPPDPGQ
jgi:hypothetical protein